MVDFSFKDNAEVDSIDKVPDTFRAAYVEKDGKFTVREDMVGIASAFDGVNKALHGERKVTTTLKGQKDVGAVLKAGLGFDTVEEAKAKFDELTSAVHAKANIDPKKIRDEIEATFTGERETLKSSVTDMEKTLKKYLVDNTAMTALSAVKGNAKLLMPHIRSSSKVVKDDATGDYVTRVMDGDGQYRGDGKGGFMGVAALVEEMKKDRDFSGAFESDALEGGQQRTQGKTPSRPEQKQALNGSRERSPLDKIGAGLKALHNR